NRISEIFLAGKILVERRYGHARLRGNIPDSRSGNAIPGKDPQRGAQDFLLAAFAAILFSLPAFTGPAVPDLCAELSPLFVFDVVEWDTNRVVKHGDQLGLLRREHSNRPNMILFQ